MYFNEHCHQLKTRPKGGVGRSRRLHVLNATAPFNNMQTLKFKAQPTNVFFATVNQMFGGSSQLPTTAERAVIKLLCTVQTMQQCSAVVVSWKDPRNI